MSLPTLRAARTKARLVLPGLQPVTAAVPAAALKLTFAHGEGAGGRVFCRVGGTARARPSLRAWVGAACLGPTVLHASDPRF